MSAYLRLMQAIEVVCVWLGFIPESFTFTLYKVQRLVAIDVGAS